MQTTLSVLIGISAIFLILFMFLWTYMRFQRIANNKENLDWHKKLWKVLFLLSLIFIFAATLVFFLK